MSPLAFLLDFQARRPVSIAVIGNSVGCGYYDSNYAGIAALLQSNGKFAPANRESDVSGGAYGSLRAHVTSLNPASKVINFSGNGWDTNDHRGISLPSSGVVGPTDTVAEILALAQKPSVVFMPLQINDPNHGLSLATFTTNTGIMIDNLQAAGIPVILVKENYTSIAGYPSFITQVDVIAASKKCQVIDTFTPFGSGTGLMFDYAHPNHAGMDVMFRTIINWLYAPLASYLTVAFGLSTARAKYAKNGALRVKAPTLGASIVPMALDSTTRIINVKTTPGIKGVIG